MLLYLSENGELSLYAAENLNQGSIKANKIDIISKLSASGTLMLSFTLPNGQPTTPVSAVSVATNVDGFNMWEYTMSGGILAYSGNLKIQAIYQIGTETLNSTLAETTVNRGNNAILPQPSTADWNTILLVYQQCRANELVAEGFAVGEQDGEAVASSSPYYHNNAKYYKEQASASAGVASTKADEASASATAAQTAKNDAVTAKNQAVSAKDDAVTAKNGAISAKDDAEDAKTDAETAANNAAGYLDTMGILYGAKQDKLVLNVNLDSVVTSGSNNPVTSNAVYNFFASLDLIQIVAELPATGQPNVIYLVPGSGTLYTAWVWENNEWKQFGQGSIDLSNYYTKPQVDALISVSALALKFEGDEFITVDENEAGTQVAISLDTDYRPYVVELSGTSGTLSETNYAILCGATSSYTAQILNGDYLFKPMTEGTTTDKYVCLDENTARIITITKPSGAWVLTTKTLADTSVDTTFSGDLTVMGMLDAQEEVYVGDHLVLRKTGTKADIVDGNGHPIDFDSEGGVRYDEAQSLTDTEKAQARTNINAETNTLKVSTSLLGG